MDTAESASGKNVKISVVQYTGGSIPLGTSGLSVTPGDAFIGHRLAVTDGTTLLGADDKAGIEIFHISHHTFHNVLYQFLPA